ncbi:hypothetical protein EDB86DRAFT_3067616 [Lactarius hatsudake]|nr:hypothetical protein EDB86DRAFT_3067616 [Lactarius hatsudake]
MSSILGGSSPPKGYPPMPPYYPAPNGAPYPPPHMQPHPGYNPHLHPMFPASPTAHPAATSSSRSALAKSFGVAPDIVQDLKLGPQPLDKGGYRGRDSIAAESAFPHDANKWVLVPMRRDSIAIWCKHIVHIYFERLNFHRPVFLRHEFEVTLAQLYAGESQQHDPGFLCSVYLIFALGTLSELNHPRDFFQRALSIKPELRVTICSLQALILLHWYLYTERQGRTLWRLLGLNHDPTTQTIFDESECQLRIRLWGIVLVHDRGTSLLLGRPLAIAPYDTNTPHPVRPKQDIINSLYSPHGQSGDAIMRHATRIVKSMKYKPYFGGTADWSLEDKTKLVQGITEDEGLTLLKIGIARILLLRALFSNKDLDFPQGTRRSWMVTIVVSHNIIVVHNQLLRFPDISFFVSPIPLHIAAMVILFGPHDVWMALDMLPSFRWRWERKETNGSHPLIATLAEKVLEVNLRQVGPSSHPVLMPELDWDLEGTGSPLATHTAASTPSLTNTNINYAHGAPGTPSFPGSPPIGPAVPPSSRILVPGPGNGVVVVATAAARTGPAKPVYPFYPTVDGRNGGAVPPSGSANAVAAAAAAAAVAGNGNGNANDYTQLLAQAAAAAAQHQAGPWGASGPENYMLEEKDVGVPVPNTMWVPDQRAMMRGPPSCPMGVYTVLVDILL